MCPVRNQLRPRSTRRHPVPIITIAVILAIAAAGLLTLRSVRNWRDDIIRENSSLTLETATRLARSAEDYFQELPTRSDGTGGEAPLVPIEILEARLTRLSNEAFSTARGVKGGFWVVGEGKFMGYADPWSPPPVPTFGPPPRSYELILAQIRETVARGEPVVRVHEFETVSVSKPVFPLATVPVHVHDRIVAVAWARIHIERELPMWKLDRILQVTAVVAVSAFLVVLLMTIRLRLEIRSLSRNLEQIARDPSRRMTESGGMFRTIREAINTMVESLEAEHNRRLSAEEQLYQQDKMASLGRMLAGVAHQVKTPLAILKTRIQIWQKDLRRFTEETGQPPPLTEESIGIALHEIDRLANLLKRLLIFARPVRKAGMKALSADDVLRNAAEYLRPMFARKEIGLEVNLAADGARIIGDPDLLREVFLNILTNSVDIVDAGGAAAVASRMDGETGRFVVDLTNSGPPVPPDLRERVFEPFYTTRQDGTGLGLAIAYEVVHAHDGTIEFVEPAGGRGAHCRVTFPLARPDSEVR